MMSLFLMAHFNKAFDMIEITSMRNYLKELAARLESIWGYL